MSECNHTVAYFEAEFLEIDEVVKKMKEECDDYDYFIKLIKFNFCPECGEKINWQEIKEKI